MLVSAIDSPAQPAQLVNAFQNLTFTQPIYGTHSPDGTNRMFIVQQNGIIRVFPNDSAVSSSAMRTFLNIQNKLSSTGGEEGLLGMAFHPNYAVNGYFYVNYTAPSPLRTVVSRYKVSTADSNKADSLSEFKIIEINQPYTNHNGGMLEFGPDGYLYIGMGDGGNGNDPGNRAQDSTQLLGKMLRIDINDTTVTTHYRIPPDNPFAGFGPSVRKEIWALGLRNPWRFSIDPQSGELWVGDVGQGAREEVDLVQKGKNYGWRIMEGMICTPGIPGCNTTGLTLPIKDYDRGIGSTITGGYIYRGSRRPSLRGAYIYADFGNGKIWMLRYNGSLTADSLLIDSPYNISSFGTDQSQELYIMSYSNGRIYRFSSNESTYADTTVNNTLPANFILFQNFPNPFNPGTSIRYVLRQNSHTSLKIYDVLGREVLSLVHEVVPSGLHNVPVERGTLTSGLYFYRLTVGGHTETKAMILLR